MGLVLDEPRDEDKIYDYDDLKMVIAADLLQELGTVNVDFRESVWRSGFSITSSKALGGSGGGCC